MSILLGIVSALCWGATDFFSGELGRKIGVVRLLFYSQTFGLLLLTALLPFHTPATIPYLFGTAFTASVLAAICNGAGTLALLKALSTGKAVLVAPIASLYGAVTTVLSLLDGNSITLATVVGLVLCISGASLASMSGNRSRSCESFLPVLMAFLAALFLGLGFWLQATFCVRSFGAVGTLWVSYLVGCVALSGVLAFKRALHFPSRSMLLRVLPVSALGVAGFFVVAYGSAIGDVNIVTVLSGLAAGVTALLGVLIRHERLHRHQWIGIAAAIFGVVFLKTMHPAFLIAQS